MTKSALAFALAAIVCTTGALAGTPVSQNFDVKATLVSACVTNNGTTNPVLDFGTYTAFGAQKTGSASIAFKCSRGLVPASVAFTSSGPYSVAGLTYTLNIGTVAPTLSTGSVDYDNYAYPVTGAIAAGQAGDNALAGAQTDTQTLQITF
ncbi:MAG: hypothetical protein ACXWC6_01910 [Ramlibacter sp.]